MLSNYIIQCKHCSNTGQVWCDQKTDIGPDNLPKPYSVFDKNPPVQSLPIKSHQPYPVAQPRRTSAPPDRPDGSDSSQQHQQLPPLRAKARDEQSYHPDINGGVAFGGGVGGAGGGGDVFRAGSDASVKYPPRHPAGGVGGSGGGGGGGMMRRGEYGMDERSWSPGGQPARAEMGGVVGGGGGGGVGRFGGRPQHGGGGIGVGYDEDPRMLNRDWRDERTYETNRPEGYPPNHPNAGYGGGGGGGGSVIPGSMGRGERYNNGSMFQSVGGGGGGGSVQHHGGRPLGGGRQPLAGGRGMGGYPGDVDYGEPHHPMPRPTAHNPPPRPREAWGEKPTPKPVPRPSPRPPIPLQAAELSEYKELCVIPDIHDLVMGVH